MHWPRCRFDAESHNRKLVSGRYSKVLRHYVDIEFGLWRNDDKGHPSFGSSGRPECSKKAPLPGIKSVEQRYQVPAVELRAPRRQLSEVVGVSASGGDYSLQGGSD